MFTSELNLICTIPIRMSLSTVNNLETLSKNLTQTQTVVLHNHLYKFAVYWPLKSTLTVFVFHDDAEVIPGLTLKHKCQNIFDSESDQVLYPVARSGAVQPFYLPFLDSNQMTNNTKLHYLWIFCLLEGLSYPHLRSIELDFHCYQESVYFLGTIFQPR